MDYHNYETLYIWYHKFNYRWCSISPSDPNRMPLCYRTEAEAIHNATMMTGAIPLWETSDTFWNKSYWKSKPEPWVTFELKDPCL